MAISQTAAAVLVRSFVSPEAICGARIDIGEGASSLQTEYNERFDVMRLARFLFQWPEIS
jgi:hypothetical protein